MKKLKPKTKKSAYNKQEEVIKTTNFLKNILHVNDFNLLIKLAETNGTHIQDINQIINEANIIANIKDKNQQAKLIMTLQAKIKSFIRFIEENIKTLSPLLNYARFFIVNSLLCQYTGIENNLYSKLKSINLENNFKKLHHDFNIKLDEFIDKSYISSNGTEIKNEIILPEELVKKIKDTHNHVSSMMINIIKYNQNIYNNEKTKAIISSVDLELNKKVRKKIVKSNEVYLQSDEIRNELDLMHFLQYQLECIKPLITFEEYAAAFDGSDEEKEMIEKDLANIKSNVGRLSHTIKSITTLINEG